MQHGSLTHKVGTFIIHKLLFQFLISNVFHFGGIGGYLMHTMHIHTYPNLNLSLIMYPCCFLANTVP